MEIWKYQNMGILKYGNSEIWKYGNMDLWKYGNMKIGKFGNKMERLAGWYGAGVLCTPVGCFFRNHFKMGCMLQCQCSYK